MTFVRSSVRIVGSLSVLGLLACQPPAAAPARPREAPSQPSQPPPPPLEVPDVVAPRPEDDDDVIVAPAAQPPLAEPVALGGPRASPAVLCPAPLQCDTSRKTFTVGPFREAVVLRARGNADANTYAVRTARGWFGNPLDPQVISRMGRSQHTPGSTTIDLNSSTSNVDGVELFTVSQGSSFVPGAGSQGSSTHLTVYSTFCKLSDGRVLCVDRGTVYSRNCRGGGGECTESGARPAGLSVE